jgi:hypothetical protein
MYDTRGGDDFIGGITVEVQRFNRATNVECQRPGLDSG